MNAACALVERAVAQGWVSYPKPAPPVQPYTLTRQQRYAQGLTARGTPRKKRTGVPALIVAQAQHDGVGVTAIYQRIRRTGTMKPSAHPNSKSGTA